MLEVERDGLLFALAVSAGSADAWSYFGLGHAFVANMTGNTVLLGTTIFLRNGDPRHLLISMGCYVAGVATASVATRKMRKENVWPREVSWTLLLEAFLMAGAEAGWIAVHRNSTSPPNGATALSVLLGCVAFAIGLQSGAMLQLKIPGIVTTYITGTWTSLMNGLMRFVTGKEGHGAKPKREFEERLLMQACILVVYFLSAVATGWLFRRMPSAVGSLSALPVLLVALYGMVRHSSDARTRGSIASSSEADHNR